MGYEIAQKRYFVCPVYGMPYPMLKRAAGNRVRHWRKKMLPAGENPDEGDDGGYDKCPQYNKAGFDNCPMRA